MRDSNDKWVFITLFGAIAVIFGGFAVSQIVDSNNEAVCKQSFRATNRTAEEILKICKTRESD